jgi:hypothetical protein
MKLSTANSILLLTGMDILSMDIGLPSAGTGNVGGGVSGVGHRSFPI